MTTTLGPRGPSWSRALAAGVAIIGAVPACSDSPTQSNPQPAIPGNVCDPGEQRCVDGVPIEIEVCRTDGRGWLSTQCPVGSSCDSASGSCAQDASSCTAGSARCTGSPGTAARQACSADGTGWLDAPCTGESVCVASSGACAPAACNAGESRCDGGPTDASRSVCAESRLEFVANDCADGASCVPTSTGAKCVNRVCTPGETKCSANHLQVLTCDVTGTVLSTTTTCDADHVCVAGACVESAAPLGGVLVQEPGQELHLGPGSYAIAVVDTSTANDVEGAFPAEITGDIADTATPPPPPPPAPSWTPCESLRLAHRFAGAKMQIGAASLLRSNDTREFHVPDPETNGSVVFVRTGKLRAVGQLVNLWEDQTVSPPGSQLPDALLDDVTSRLDDAIIPRVETLSGAPTDVDANGRIDVLFTDLLPTTSVAAFVFPTATLFASAPGESQVDFGEVAYVQGLNAGMGEAELMAVLSHEIQHLVYFGRRLTPYLGDPASVPDSIGDDVYAVEGLATAAMGWSGQYYAPPMVAALEAPAEFSLWRLAAQTYLQEPSANFASYGFGALVQQYLMQQAGGFTVQGGGSMLVDSGGASFVDAFTTGASGWTRIEPSDGRALAQWYTDFAAALIVDTLGAHVSQQTASNPLYAIGAASLDPAWGGFLGPTLRYEWMVGATKSGPILRRLAWASRPSTLKAGGMSFEDLEVGEQGAKVTLTTPTARAVIVRYDP